MPQVLGESNNKHQDLQSRENKFCVKDWRDGKERWAEKEVGRPMERAAGFPERLESWHCIWDASVGLVLGLKGWVGSKGRKLRGGYFSASRSAGLESKEAGRGESRDWWEEKVYEKPFLVHVCGVYAQMCRWVHVSVCACVCTCIFVCKCTHMYMHICVYICVHLC